jgi:release factor glutamine methyltransferase
MRVHYLTVARGAERLAGRCDDPRHEAEILFAHALGLKSRSDLYVRTLSPGEEQLRRFDRMIGERASGVPLQYILGYAHFYRGCFHVPRGVFIPRPETERLVEAAIRLYGDPKRAGKILELGVGCGAVLLSLLEALPSAQGLGVDVSESAILCASENAERHGVAERTSLSTGDLFTAMSPQLFDLIVSNPPYVAEGTDLPVEVRDHEPGVALYGGPDGLVVIRRIIIEAPSWIVSHGALALEVGEGQADEVLALIHQRGAYARVELLDDLAGKHRVLAARLRR